jgi:hypothetical protein
MKFARKVDSGGTIRFGAASTSGKRSVTLDANSPAG